MLQQMSYMVFIFNISIVGDFLSKQETTSKNHVIHILTHPLRGIRKSYYQFFFLDNKSSMWRI